MQVAHEHDTGLGQQRQVLGLTKDAHVRGDQAFKLRRDGQAGADHGHDRRQAVAVVRHPVIAPPGVQGVAGPQTAETITVEHRQWQRRLLMSAVALRLGPDKTFLAQQLADFAARFASNDGQVQVLAHQQLF
ncbi:hypothetical protein D3C78_1055980 [compost metagenome]